jgi:uncharacterized protein with ParB-like and HNH nuclease domain
MSKIDTMVGKLVDMITGGDLRLPEMQRRYVWPATWVRDLLDSLDRGCPSGNDPGLGDREGDAQPRLGCRPARQPLQRP